MRQMLSLGVTVAAAYAMVCALAFAFQDRLVWFPGPPPQVTPAALGLTFQDAEIVASDGVRLHGWYMPNGPVTVLINNGNAGTVENRLELIAAFCAMGLSVLAYDYRGYGRSEGTPTEEGTYLDAEAAYDWLREQGTKPSDIVLYGESLGGAVAIALASDREAAVLIVENTFTSLPDIGARAYPFLPVRLLSRIRYDSLARAPRITIPVMVIHSPGDDIVPFDQGKRLFEALPEPKQFLETGGGHNAGGFLQRREWRAAVQEFIDQ